MITYLRKIHFALTNKLCINLKYNDTYRLIEPDSLRNNRSGDLLLYALLYETEEWRSYRVDRIQDMDVSFIEKTQREVLNEKSSSYVKVRENN